MPDDYYSKVLDSFWILDKKYRNSIITLKKYVLQKKNLGPILISRRKFTLTVLKWTQN